MRISFLLVVVLTLVLLAAACFCTPRFRHVDIENFGFSPNDQHLVCIAAPANRLSIIKSNFIRVWEISSQKHTDFWHNEFAQRTFSPNIYFETSRKIIAYETTFGENSEERSFVCDLDNNICQETFFNGLDFQAECSVRSSFVKPLWYIENKDNAFQQDLLDESSEFFREQWTFIDFRDPKQTIYLAKKHLATENLSRLEILDRSSGERNTVELKGRLDFQSAPDHETFYFFGNGDCLLLNPRLTKQIPISPGNSQPGFFSPDGSLFAIVDEQDRIQVYDCRKMAWLFEVACHSETDSTEKTTEKFDVSNVRICFSHRGNRMAIAGNLENRGIEIRDSISGELLEKIEIPVDWMKTVLFSIGFILIGIFAGIALWKKQGDKTIGPTGAAVVIGLLGITLIFVTNYFVFGGMSLANETALSGLIGGLADKTANGLCLIAGFNLAGALDGGIWIEIPGSRIKSKLNLTRR